MTAQTTPPPASQQATPMKRAGQLIAHLNVLHQIRDLRQLMLLQFVMSGRQDQVALFRREGEDVTFSVIGTQPALTGPELTHRSGNVPAEALFSQLQTLSGIQGDDVAFSAAQITQLISARTTVIEEGDDLAKLDAALNAMVSRGLPDEHQTAEHQTAERQTAERQTDGQQTTEQPTTPEDQRPQPQETQTQETQTQETPSSAALYSAARSAAALASESIASAVRSLANRPRPDPADTDVPTGTAEAGRVEDNGALPDAATATDPDDQVAEFAQASSRRGTRRSS